MYHEKFVKANRVVAWINGTFLRRPKSKSDSYFRPNRFKPKGSFVRKRAPSKGNQPKGDFGAKPKGACFNCNEVGHYSKDCPKSKSGVGSSKVLALNATLAQKECNRLIFLKGKISKRDILCLLDTGASHNFITQESAKRMDDALPSHGVKPI